MKTLDTSLRLAALLVGAMALLAACGAQQPAQEPAQEKGASDGEPAETGDTVEQRYPDVLEAGLEPAGDTWDLDVTISSPYDSPGRYANGWRVLAPDGTVLGEHELMHDHADEQPFTRTQTGLEIPEGVEEITVEGRDLENGYGGKTVTVERE